MVARKGPCPPYKKTLPQIEVTLAERSVQLLAGTYRPTLMCCRYMTKGADKGQVVCQSSVRDQLVQQAILSVLGPLAEATFHNGFGVLGKDAPKLALAKVRHSVKDGYVWLGMGQIADCLDNLKQRAVLNSVQRLCGDSALVQVVRLTLSSWPTEFRPGPNQGLPPHMFVCPTANCYSWRCQLVNDVVTGRRGSSSQCCVVASTRQG